MSDNTFFTEKSLPTKIKEDHKWLLGPVLVKAVQEHITSLRVVGKHCYC